MLTGSAEREKVLQAHGAGKGKSGKGTAYTEMCLRDRAWVWCIGAVLGWVWIPIMNANMDVLFRSYIPVNMQGRVYSARNTLQFFTIPIGYFLGGFLVDHVFEPFMSGQPAAGVWHTLFGVGKGSGAAFFFFVIGCVGVITCLIFRRNQHIWQLETQNSEKV